MSDCNYYYNDNVIIIIIIMHEQGMHEASYEVSDTPLVACTCLLLSVQ